MSTTANYVVAYEATERGDEAVQLGIALARLTGAQLRLCLVLSHPISVPAKVPAGDSAYRELLEAQALHWLAQGLASVPADVIATSHLLWAESVSEGLIEAAQRFDSDRIVVGAARDGILQRFTVGSVAGALLHASPVPVALAPRGYRAVDVGRITCAVGTRQGWENLLDSMAAISEHLDIPLRIVTVVALDGEEIDPAAGARQQNQADAHLAVVLDHFSATAHTRGPITTEIAVGRSIESAVEQLDWRPDEIVLVGSSRLAQPSRIFLGVTAHRMLHALPVPLIVVPATQRS